MLSRGKSDRPTLALRPKTPRQGPGVDIAGALPHQGHDARQIPLGTANKTEGREE